MRNVTLTTDRLLLREFTEADWEAAHAFEAHPAANRYKGGEPETAQETQARIGRVIAESREEPRRRYVLAVVRRTDDRLMGRCNLNVVAPDDREAEIGYKMHPELWGQGYATEATRALLWFGFESLNLHRVFAQCASENAASARVMEKVGLRPEGILREQKRFQDRWWDVLSYAVLEDEWRMAHPPRLDTQAPLGL